MKKFHLHILILMMIIILATGCTTSVATQDAEAKIFDETKGLVSQGIIEAREVSLNSKIPGRIGKIYFEEGAEIKAGDIMVEMESDELQAKKEQALALVKAAEGSFNAAKGQVAAAQSLLEKAQHGAREQEIAQAQAHYDLMVRTYDRVEKLFEKGAVSEQKKDEIATQLEVSKQQLSMAEEGARSEDISSAQALVSQALAMEQAARGKVEQAQAGLQEVEAYLKDIKIPSPINGVITQLNADEGELVSSGMSIGTVTDIKNTWVEVKVAETDLAQVSIDQDVDIKVPAFSDEVFKGTVVRINRKPDFATERATNDNGNFDIVAFGVKITIENKNMELKPGMTAFAQFLK